jgi:hypothetical protein
MEIQTMRIFFVLVLLFSLPVIAAEPDTPKTMAEAFLSSIQRGDISNGYDRLFLGSGIPQEKPQEIAVVKQQTQTVVPLYGKILGFELSKEEHYGSSITRLVYILKSEKAPTIWEFYFYKPRNSWFLANVFFNDHFNGLR